MSIKRRVDKLEDAAGAPGDFTFILIGTEPKTYQGSDGKRYGEVAITKRLADMGAQLQVRIGWDGMPEEPEPNTLYIGWGDDDLAEWAEKRAIGHVRPEDWEAI